MPALTLIAGRLVLLACLLAGGVLFGWVKGADHVRDAWDAERAATAIVVAKQQARAVRIEAAQKLTTEKIGHEIDTALARSDAYWGRLRYPPRPGRLPDAPGAAAATDAAAPADATDPAGDTSGACSPADGSADAIVIIEWQRWWRGVSAATALPESARD